jgi:hypothetical protein
MSETWQAIPQPASSVVQNSVGVVGWRLCQLALSRPFSG